jgi:hypothetical protein
MVTIETLAGTTVNEYDDNNEFVEALRKSDAPRVHTFNQLGLFSRTWLATFMDGENQVHFFSTAAKGDEYQSQIRPIYDAMAEKQVPEVDGILKVSPANGIIYQIFEADPGSSVEDKAQVAHDAWIEAVKTLPFEGTIIHYLKADDDIVVDAIKERTHFVTVLKSADGFTLEDTLKKLARISDNAGGTIAGGPRYQTQDNGPVVTWYKELLRK